MSEPLMYMMSGERSRDKRREKSRKKSREKSWEKNREKSGEKNLKARKTSGKKLKGEKKVRKKRRLIGSQKASVILRYCLRSLRL